MQIDELRAEQAAVPEPLSREEAEELRHIITKSLLGKRRLQRATHTVAPEHKSVRKIAGSVTQCAHHC